MFVALLAAVFAVSVPAMASNDFEDDQVVVGLAPGADIGAINARYGTVTIDHVPGTSDYLLGTAPGQNLDVIVASMSGDPDIAYAEKNHVSEAAEGIQGTIASVDRSATSATFHTQPSATVVHAAQAHALSTGSQVVIAVVDGGVDPFHPELAGHLSGLGFDFVQTDAQPWETANGVDDDQDGLVDEGFGHGSHVAGIALLAAPDAIILPVRVLDDEGRGSAYRVSLGIRYAADHGASVINLSLAIRAHSSLVAEALHYASDRGAVIVAGAGNRGAGSLDFPASESDVIGVASTDPQGVKMAASNYGAACDIAAPGQDVLSAYGDTDYAVWSGTSMAAGFVSGGAAVLRARYPDLPPDDVLRLIGDTATNIAPQNPAYPGLLGAGLIDLERLSTVAAPSAGSLHVEGGASSFVTWQPMEGATGYDVIRGSVANLEWSDPDRVSLGRVVCLANDTTALTTASSPETAVPQPGRAFFYLVRPIDGTVHSDYQETAHEFDRDAGPGDCDR